MRRSVWATLTVLFVIAVIVIGWRTFGIRTYHLTSPAQLLGIRAPGGQVWYVKQVKLPGVGAIVDMYTGSMMDSGMFDNYCPNMYNPVPPPCTAKGVLDKRISSTVYADGSADLSLPAGWRLMTPGKLAERVELLPQETVGLLDANGNQAFISVKPPLVGKDPWEVVLEGNPGYPDGGYALLYWCDQGKTCETGFQLAGQHLSLKVNGVNGTAVLEADRGFSLLE